MNKLHKICVFCGSSDGNDLSITDAAVKLGKLFVEKEIEHLVWAGQVSEPAGP